MANSNTGRILSISQAQNVPSKDGSKTYVKRELVLDATRFDPYTGERGFENTPSFEFFGDKCTELDRYRVGQVVTISFDLQGNKYVNRDGQQKIITSVRPYKIELKQISQQTQPAVQQQGYQQAQQQNTPFPQHPGYQQQSATPFPQQGFQSNDAPF